MIDAIGSEKESQPDQCTVESVSTRMNDMSVVSRLQSDVAMLAIFSRS